MKSPAQTHGKLQEIVLKMDAKLDGVEMKRTRHINSRRLPERPHGQAGIDQDNTEQ